MGLVYHLIDLLAPHVRTSSDYEDYCQIGSIALIKAADTFDVDTGYQFSTYACVIIKHDIWRALSLTSRQGMGRGKFPGKIDSLQTPDYDGTERFFYLADPKTIDDNTDAVLDAQRIHRYLPYLTPQEQEVLRLKFFDGELNLTQIAERFGLSKERIRQVQLRAFEKLYNWLTGLSPFPPPVVDMGVTMSRGTNEITPLNTDRGRATDPRRGPATSRQSAGKAGGCGPTEGVGGLVGRKRRTRTRKGAAVDGPQ